MILCADQSTSSVSIGPSLLSVNPAYYFSKILTDDREFSVANKRFRCCERMKQQCHRDSLWRLLTVLVIKTNFTDNISKFQIRGHSFIHVHTAFEQIKHTKWLHSHNFRNRMLYRGLKLGWGDSRDGHDTLKFETEKRLRRWLSQPIETRPRWDLRPSWDRRTITGNQRVIRWGSTIGSY